jgi:hypothetical protein
LAAGLLLAFHVARADTPGPATAAAAAPCAVSIDDSDNFHLGSLPALSADGTRIAVPQRCDDRRGPSCLTIAFFSADGQVRQRIEITRAEEGWRSEAPLPSSLRPTIAARLARVNGVLAEGHFTRMLPLDIPFSEIDLNLMRLPVGDVTVGYHGGTLVVDRNDRRLVMRELPQSSTCSEPWIRSLFLHERMHAFLVEYGYRDNGGCPFSAGWRVVRFQ